MLRASTWQDYAAGEEIVKEGEMDDRFYMLVTGNCTVERHGKRSVRMETGDCFGETSYVRGARRTATIARETAVSVLKVSSTLLEQVSAACQLRFNRVFLRSLIGAAAGQRSPGGRDSSEPELRSQREHVQVLADLRRHPAACSAPGQRAACCPGPLDSGDPRRSTGSSSSP